MLHAMKTLVTLALALLFGTSWFGARSVRGDVEWETNLDEAFVAAGESGRPLLIVFR